ncbi:phosphotransferase [Actinopolymorpha alba]|uniref:phosphotransferase n=1 Tax=Actinopolymorpha alba TaxID=533267 RepID=UPI0003750A20|nr:phosphotransferase [Actinopolymorpha alba]
MDIVAVAEELLEATPVSVRPTGSSTAFLIDLDDRTVVLKFPAPGRSVLAEAWAYQAASAQGVRVPAVLATRADPEVVAVEFLPGVSLWSDERRGRDNSLVWQRAGEQLRALHEIRVSGFGLLGSDARGFRGRADTWCPFVRSAREEGLGRLVDAGVLDSRAGRRLESRYDEAAADLHSWTDRDFLLPLYLLAFVIRHAVQLAEQGELKDARAHLVETRYERLL